MNNTELPACPEQINKKRIIQLEAAKQYDSFTINSWTNFANKLSRFDWPGQLFNMSKHCRFSAAGGAELQVGDLLQLSIQYPQKKQPWWKGTGSPYNPRHKVTDVQSLFLDLAFLTSTNKDQWLRTLIQKYEGLLQLAVLSEIHPKADDFKILSNQQPNLVKLDFRALCNIDDKAMKEIGKLTQVRAINLSMYRHRCRCPQASACGYEQLQALKDLEYLNIHGGKLDRDCLMEIGQLTNLKQLSLSSDTLDESCLKQVGQLTNLKELHLSSDAMENADLGHLSELQSLEELSLSYKTFGDEAFVHLSKLKSLRRLYLPQLYDGVISSQGLEQLQALEELRYLHLCDNKKMLGLSAIGALSEITNLEYLRLFR